MSTYAKGTFEITNWDEKTWDGKNWKEVPGAKLTRATVTKAIHGAIEGEVTSESLTVYRSDTSASYIGLERVVGRIGNRSGSFVLQGTGTFENDTATTTWSVVPGSGTGELQGLQGEGGFVARHGEGKVPYTLNYEFKK
jgi:hypothetical protein